MNPTLASRGSYLTKEDAIIALIFFEKFHSAVLCGFSMFTLILDKYFVFIYNNINELSWMRNLTTVKIKITRLESSQKYFVH